MAHSVHVKLFIYLQLALSWLFAGLACIPTIHANSLAGQWLVLGPVSAVELAVCINHNSGLLIIQFQLVSCTSILCKLAENLYFIQLLQS